MPGRRDADCFDWQVGVGNLSEVNCVWRKTDSADDGAANRELAFPDERSVESNGDRSLLKPGADCGRVKSAEDFAFFPLP